MIWMPRMSEGEVWPGPAPKYPRSPISPDARLCVGAMTSTRVFRVSTFPPHKIADSAGYSEIFDE